MIMIWCIIPIPIASNKNRLRDRHSLRNLFKLFFRYKITMIPILLSHNKLDRILCRHPNGFF